METRSKHWPYKHRHRKADCVGDDLPHRWGRLQERCRSLVLYVVSPPPLLAETSPWKNLALGSSTAAFPGQTDTQHPSSSQQTWLATPEITIFVSAIYIWQPVGITATKFFF